VIDPLRNAIRIFKSPEKEINIIFIRIYWNWQSKKNVCGWDFNN